MARKSDVGKTASAITKQDLGAQLAALTTLTPEQIDEMFPRQKDKAELLALIEAVNAAKSANAAKAVIIAHIDNFAGVLLKLVKHVVL